MGTKVIRITELTVITLESLPPQYVINVKGQVNTGGWSNPRLELVGAMTDGIQNYAFVMDPPKPGVKVTRDTATHTASINLGRASSSIEGIRVHSATNNIEKLFDLGKSESMVIAGGGDAWPWSMNTAGGVDVWPWSVKQMPENTPVSLRDIIGHVVRVVRPGDLVTQEFQPGRVTISLDDKSRATDVVVEPGADV